jgi:hypothetical protein
VCDREVVADLGEVSCQIHSRSGAAHKLTSESYCQVLALATMDPLFAGKIPHRPRLVPPTDHPAQGK